MNRKSKISNSNYNYDIICNKDEYVDDKQIENILESAKKAFRNKNYDSIMLFYSGHGTQDYLVLSNWTSKNGRKVNKTFSRDTIESYLDGYNVKDKAKTHKFYFFRFLSGSKRFESYTN